MKNILKIGLIFFAGLILAFKKQHKDNDKTLEGNSTDSAANFVIISVDNFNNVDNKRLNFYYHDSLAYGHPVFIAGKETKLLLGAPTLLLESSDKQTPFFILPGEKINIKFAGSDSVQLYINDNKQRSNELDFFRKLVQQTGNVYAVFKILPYVKKVNTLNDMYKLEELINDKKIERLKFLDSYSKQCTVSSNFFKISTNLINCTAISDTLTLYQNNKALLAQNLFQKEILAKLIPLKKIEFTPLQFYFNTCNTLVSLFLFGVPHHVISTSPEFTKTFDFIETEFTGITKDFLLANIIYIAHTNQIPISTNYIQKFNIQCKDKGYKKLINEELNNKNNLEGLKDDNKLLLADGKIVGDLKDVIFKNKGKIILLDFWASWCAPCREEMPYLNLLKKTYKDKNVTFLGISTDKNIKDWINANNEESLGENESFKLTEPEKAAFVRQYHINSIPRYMLIGKDGKVISDDAPRPSDPQLKLLINKYL